MKAGKSPAARQDICLVAIVILIGGVLYYGALDIPPPRFDPLGSAAVPKTIAVSLAVLAVLLFIQNAAGWRGGVISAPRDMEGADEVAESTGEYRADPAAALASIVIPVVYVLSIQYGLFDFAIGSTLFAFAYGLVFMPVLRRRMVWLLVPASIAIGVGLTLAYTQLFTIDLPLDALFSLGLSL
ncbi:MAG TPA: tripartite tricarboxylate transporter TctB family protein [Afifellaceae bacterium]|nr:tripartite tricarboxylate transporter TctB family protein [Afifellaceae bacterium]